jgi:superfamily II helicase
MDHMQRSFSESASGGLAVVLPRCCVCNQVPAEGIKAVIRVGNAWICNQCEQEIVQLEVGSPDYGVILDKIRRVWKS